MEIFIVLTLRWMEEGKVTGFELTYYIGLVKVVIVLCAPSKFWFWRRIHVIINFAGLYMQLSVSSLYKYNGYFVCKNEKDTGFFPYRCSSHDCQFFMPKKLNFVGIHKIWIVWGVFMEKAKQSLQ